MLDFLQLFFSELLELVNAMSPYLLLGFLFAGILKVWFPQRWIDRYMGNSNLKSAVNTAIIGIPLPLCSCGVIPTGISFYKNGASKGSSVSFLISTPQTGVDSILVTYSLLGLPFAIVRVIVALVTGILGGVFTNIFESTDRSMNITTETCKDGCSSSTTKESRFLSMLKYGFNEFLMDIAQWLIIGIIIAAILSTVIPDAFFTMFLQNEALSMLTILAASIPIYLCATASVPIAAVLMMKGLSPGAVLILLMAGPATNAATITIIKKVFGNRTLFSYLFSIIGGAFIFGLIINHALPAEWFKIMNHSHAHHQHETIPFWLQLLSSVILISLIIYGYIKKYLSLNKEKNSSQTLNVETTVLHTNSNISFTPGQFSFAGKLNTKFFKVEGMTCSHCKTSVEINLKNLKGINSVVATPALNKVEINGSRIDTIEVKKMINDLGYFFKGEIK